MKNKTERRVLKKRQKDMIFVACWAILPIVQYFIFYICVNFNSVIMAFQRFDRDLANQSGKYVFSGLDNFKSLIQEFFRDGLFFTCLKNSFTYYVANFIFGTTLGVVFAYYIFKKKFASKFYKIMLFLPSIISSIVLITIFKYFANFVVPQLCQRWFDVKVPALTSDVATTLATIIFYNIFAGFGTSILLYSGAMTNVSESVLEAAEIDGVGPVREFIQIIVPLIYPTLKTLLITGVATIFTSDIGLFSFYGTGAKPYLYTFGYYILRGARTATLAEYPYLASVGVALTLIAVPLTFFIRWLLTRFGPSVE